MAEKKPWERYAEQPAQGTTFQTNPYESDEQRREEERLRNEQERIRLAREAAARDAANDALTREEKASELAREAEEQARLESAQRSGMSDALYQLRNTIDAAKTAQRIAKDGSGIGSYEGSQGFRDSAIWSILGANSAALDVESQLNTVGSNTAFDRLQKMREESPTGGALGAVSEIELRLLRDSIASLSQQQSDEQFERSLQKVIDAYTRVAAKLYSAERYMRENGSMEGYSPPSEEELRNFSFDEPTAPITPQGMELAGSGATETSIPVPDEMQAAYSDYINRNWGNIEAADLSRFMSGLEAQYNRGVGVPDYSAFADRLNQAAADGAQPDVVGPIPATNRELDAGEQLLNNFVSSPTGTGVTSFANAVGGGIPAASAGRERMQALQDINPKAAFAGDMLGGTLGTFGTGLGLGAVGKALGASGRTGAALANPFTADAVYGTGYGALSADDAITGALTGFGGALAGDQIGKRVGGLATRAFGPDDPLSAGERAIATVAGADGLDAQIAQNLSRAGDLGVPMTLADASPELRSLGGSAVRFSPTTAGQARDVFAMRNQGQGDRLAEAVARDLGPVENIPQRSEDLLQQARAQAAPLYEQAYAAPGAENIDLSDLVGRPTFDKALREAYSEVLDEGIDPSAAGLELVGEDVLLASPSWQSMDLAKRGLDNIIERGIRQGDMPEVRRAQQMKQALLSRMDEANPAYAQARQAYAGPVQERGFMEQGQQAYNARPDQLGVDIQGLTPEQQAQMRLGYQSEIMGRAGNLRNNSNPWAQLNTPNTEGRMQVLYGGAEDADIARLLDQRDLELQMAGSANSITGNSLTAEREISDAFFRQQPGMGADASNMILESAVMGGPFITVGKSLGDRFLRDRREAAAAKANRALADELGPLLFDGTPADAAGRFSQILEEGGKYDEKIARLLARDQRIGSTLGSGISAAALDYFAY
ncbi:MAG: hypothetical protein JKY36_07240 [Erythrobacter sp.]|nr:hypothetical protein [Erythrobacter sp.]